LGGGCPWGKRAGFWVFSKEIRALPREGGIKPDLFPVTSRRILRGKKKGVRKIRAAEKILLPGCGKVSAERGNDDLVKKRPLLSRKKTRNRSQDLEGHRGEEGGVPAAGNGLNRQKPFRVEGKRKKDKHREGKRSTP